MTWLLFLKYKNRTLSILTLRKLFQVLFLLYFTASVKQQETISREGGVFFPAECISISRKSQIASHFEFYSLNKIFSNHNTNESSDYNDGYSMLWCWEHNYKRTSTLPLWVRILINYFNKNIFISMIDVFLPLP